MWYASTREKLDKNAEAIETMRKIDTLVVDKTGTLTLGKPKLTEVIVADGYKQDEVTAMAASLEKSSEHPLAAAVVAGAENRKISLFDSENFESFTGKGVFGMVAGYNVDWIKRGLSLLAKVSAFVLFFAANYPDVLPAVIDICAVVGIFAGFFLDICFKNI